MQHETTTPVIKRARIKFNHIPCYLGRFATAVSELGGGFGELRTVHIGKGHKVRDVDITVPTEEAFEAICEAVRTMEGVELLEVHDVVEQAHAGGKIEIRARVKAETLDDLALIYTPGVASVCRKIHANPSLADSLTSIRHNVAIVTNGTAILGLGDIGPVAGMPVMEGKSLLFKVLADINGYPILIDSHDPEVIIAAVKAIAPTFGAIKLEDIRAPECFEIERRLDAELDIPVLHDDQHGTGVVVLAALINIARYTGLDLSNASVGLIGLGAAGTGISRLLRAYGVTDIRGADKSPAALDRFASDGGQATDLAGVMAGSQIVIATTGAPGLIAPEMVRPGQVILALSNPNPEIHPDDALEAGAVYAAGGRAVNNALAFPGLFRGALDARARFIDDPMKIAAARAIASFALDGDLVPNILDPTVHAAVAEAVAAAAFASGAAVRPAA